MRKYRIIKRGKEARELLKEGVDAVANVVKMTLGPYGRNVVVGLSEWKAPLVTNDGVTVARYVVLKNPIANLGAKIAMESAKRTNDLAGDGTTTSTVIMQAIVEKIFKKLDVPLMGSNENVMELYRKINVGKTMVVEELRKMAKPVNSLEELEEVAFAACENRELAKIVSELVWKVGPDGFIDVEERPGFDVGDVQSDLMEGMKFLGTYAADFMITNPEKREVRVNKVPILVTNHEVDDVSLMRPANPNSTLLTDLAKTGTKNLIIFAPKFTKKSLLAFSYVVQGAGFRVFAIKVPSLTEEELSDVATYTGATFVDSRENMEISDVGTEKLGFAEKVIVNRDDVVIVGGKGPKEDVDKRIGILKKQIEEEKTEMFKKKLKRRIASLSTGVGKIYIGARTETEKGYLKYKVEDAKNACKGALEEGTVPGGGLALKMIAEKLSSDDLLKEALVAPWKQIQENAGGSLELPKNLADPLKVTRLALENACSVAGTLITTEAALEEVDDDIEALRELLIIEPDEPASIHEDEIPQDIKIF